MDKFEGTRSDPEYATSVAADHAISAKAPNLRIKLLSQYLLAGADGLTDDEAAEKAGLLDACYWKRCNELRQEGLIINTGRTRPGLKGVKRIVCATPQGLSL